MTFLYKADPARGAEWAELFARKMPEMPFRIWPDIGDPSEVRAASSPSRCSTGCRRAPP